MTRKQLANIAIILITCLTLSGCGSNAVKESDETQNQEVSVDVKVIHPQQASDGIYLEAQGKVNSNSTFSIPALSDGKISRTYANVGEPVRQGQTIAYLSNPESNTELATLQNKLKVNQSAISNLESRLKTSKEMVNLGIVAKNEITTIQNDINTRRLERQDILSPIKRLQIRQNNYRVASNYSGYIANIMPEGTFVTYGQTIASIISLASLYVETFVPVDQVNAVKIGQDTLITANGLSVSGKVTDIYPNASSNLIRVLVHPDRALPVNLDVKVNLKTRGVKGIVIPKSAVVLNEGKPTVFLVKNGKAYQKFVTIQKDYVDKVIVSSGIAQSDCIVINNANLLSDGIKVSIK